MRDGTETAGAAIRTLELPSSRGVFPAAVRPLVERLDLALAADDGMYAGDDDHYLCCGASALNVVQSAHQVAEMPPPRSILDFGSGAGRVTRWLRAAFPESTIACCDLRTRDLDFCRDRFAADTWISGTDVAALSAPGRYDLIWLGSVLTHLSADVSRALLDRVMGWSNPGGLVVASTIGRAGKARQERDGEFIDPQGWGRVLGGFADAGFGYCDYADDVGYGLSLIAPSWLSRAVETTPGWRLVLMAERAWDGLHDIVAIQNSPGTAAIAYHPRPDARDHEIAALRARVSALEGSTTWRVTEPLRRLIGRWR